MRQAMEDGVTEVLSSVVEDVGQAMDRNISGAHILHELLSAPWLRTVLKMYECLLQFQQSTPTPFLPYASGLSHEIMTVIQKLHRPSAEARELYSLLSSPHIQALLSSHDSVAQSDYGPVLPPLPDEMPEDEEAMRIVCLVKNNQPLNREERRGSLGDGIGLIRSRWSSLRRFTLDRLVPARRAWSGEELRATESETRPLPLPRGSQSRPFVPQYESTGSCCLCPQSTELQKKGLNQSAPSVFSSAACAGGSFSEKPKHIREEHASTGGSSDDYAYPPPPVPAYSLSLPNSPVLYKRGPTGGHSRNIPTPGRISASKLRANTAPSSPATLRCTRQQGVSTLPTNGRSQGGHRGSNSKLHEQSSLLVNYSTSPRHKGSKNHTKQARNEQQHPPQHLQPPDLTKQCNVEELWPTGSSNNSQDAHHVGEKMVLATERITVSAEDNTQALNLLVEVVDKLQGLIVASKNPEVSPSRRKKKSTPPTPPPRVSSISPKVIRKPPTPYPRHLSSSSSSSRSSSSSSSSSDSAKDLKRMKRGAKKTVVTFAATQRAGVSGSNGQGATIRRDEETGEIYIARVIRGGLADRSGLLHPGDMLVEVNGKPVVGLEPEQVIQILINSHGTILFKVIPNAAQSSSSQKSVYMRAMVDYSPLQDSSIPCPNAGMPFSRGDLLEVVDQSDAQWWQARKMPCAVSCAGLIPSASMLKSKQREQWWCQPLQIHTCIRPLTLPDDEDDRLHADNRFALSEEAECDITDGIYMAGFRRSFRLWRRTSFRRRRQSCTSCSPNSSALSTPYEEVALYQRPPQENHRLIILIGASGVGVTELRKRLIKHNPSTFQGPIPHTTRPMKAGEQTGREYHFVTKELFEYMVCNNRFVEYGEHKGQLYGTSIDAIDDVLKRGRMCIIDVEPHSIQALRTRKLKPFVIFIKAPSPDILRQSRRDAQLITNHSFNRAFTEEDFVELEEASRLIEAKYRHFFDHVLVNDILHDACMQLCSSIQEAQEEPQWIPVSWSRPEE